MEELKKCSKCGELKVLKDFNKRKDSIDGYMGQCIDCIKLINGEYYKENRNNLIKFNQKYRVDNREVRRASSKLRRLDPVFRFIDNTRRSLNGYLKNNSDRCYNIIGCSYEDYIKYLNNNKYNLVYKKDEVDVDHKIPISRAKTITEAKELFKYTNTHLLPTSYNRSIKKNKDWDESNFEEYMRNNN